MTTNPQLYNSSLRKQTLFIEEQKKMNEDEAKNELVQITYNAIYDYCLSKNLMNFEIDDFSQDVLVKIISSPQLDSFIRYIRKGDSRAVYNYIKKVCRSLFRDAVQERNIRMNTEYLSNDPHITELYYAKEGRALSLWFWTEYNFPQRIKSVKEDSKDWNQILRICSELQERAFKKNHKGEKLTDQEINALIKLKKKVVSYQLY